MRLLAFTIVILLTTGCSLFEGSCVTVEGGMDKYRGGVTYCYKAEKSKALEAPVTTGTDESGEEKEFFGIDMNEIQGIIDKLRGKEDEKENEETPGIRSLSAPTKPEPESAEKKHPLQQLRDLLQP